MKKSICLIRGRGVAISCDGKRVEVLGNEDIRNWIEELIEDANSEYRQLVSNGTMDDPVMYLAASIEALEEFMTDPKNFGAQFVSDWTMDDPVVSPATSVPDYFESGPYWEDNLYFHYSEDNLTRVNEILVSDCEIGGEGGQAGRTRRAASRAVETAQRVGRNILDRLRGRKKMRKFVRTLGDLLRWRGR